MCSFTSPLYGNTVDVLAKKKKKEKKKKYTLIDLFGMSSFNFLLKKQHIHLVYIVVIL